MSSPKHQLNGPDGVGSMPYLPLSSDDGAAGEQSIGKLVGDATQHLSTLVRAEVELAKSELVGEVKKATKGSVYFLVALTVLLYSTFFLFFVCYEVLKVWLPAWLSMLIVFGAMLVCAGAFGYLGYRKVRKIRAPERTIGSVKETAAALRPGRSGDGVPAAD